MIRDADLVIDVRGGERHFRLWSPVARELVARGLRPALVAPDVEVAGEVDRRLVTESGAPSGVTRAPVVPTGRLASLGHLRRAIAPHIPWRGGLGAAAAALELSWHWALCGWLDGLRLSSVRAVVTTTPTALASHAMVTAAGQLGLTSIYMQHAFMHRRACSLVPCQAAVVWSALGEQELRACGWRDARIERAKNPSIPDERALIRLRQRRRAELGIRDDWCCALFAGQRATDQAVAVEGYLESCAMVCEALKSLGGERRVTVLRPHVAEKVAETEGLFRASGVPHLLVSSGAPLAEDLAASDVVVSMHSAVLEEAHLAGRPIVQAMAGDGEPTLSFACLGAPLVRSSRALAEAVRALASRGASTCEVLRSAADAIASLASEGESQR